MKHGLIQKRTLKKQFYVVWFEKTYKINTLTKEPISFFHLANNSPQWSELTKMVLCKLNKHNFIYKSHMQHVWENFLDLLLLNT